MGLIPDYGDWSGEVIQGSRTGRSRSEMPRGRPGEDGSDPNLQFVQVVRILRQYIKSILSVTVLGTALAGVVGWWIPPKYTATALIMVDPQPADSIRRLSANSRAPDQPTIDTQVTMLSSRDHIRRVLESLSQQRDLSASGSGSGSTPDTVEPADLTREIDELERRLKVMQVRQSRVISISVTAKKPEDAARIANRIAVLHIAATAQEKRAEVSRELMRLEERATELKADMKERADLLQKTLEGGVDRDDVHLGDLKREAAAVGQAYVGLLRRQKDLREEQESITPEAHVLARATPPDRPSSPNFLLFMFPAMIASAICGSLMAVLRARTDNRLRSERDVSEALGIPCIALVPQLPRFRSTAANHLLKKPFAPYTEAIRSSIAALQLTATERSPVTVLICSSVPGEGKTTFALSLALFTARLGKRTLLVDFDFRRRSILRRKHARDLDGASDLQLRPGAELIRRLPDLDIDYLPIPRSPVDPLAIFAGAHLREFLHRLRDNYDCVFIDSPPLLGIAESRLLRTLADKVLFIIKWGSTRREVAQNALHLLREPIEDDDDRSPNTSAIITQVNLRRHAKYRYGDAAETFVRYKKYYFNPRAG